MRKHHLKDGGWWKGKKSDDVFESQLFYSLNGLKFFIVLDNRSWSCVCRVISFWYSGFKLSVLSDRRVQSMDSWALISFLFKHAHFRLAWHWQLVYGCLCDKVRTVCLPGVGDNWVVVVFAAVNVRMHQTCIALNTDSITSRTINDGLAITIDFELDLCGSVDLSLRGKRSLSGDAGVGGVSSLKCFKLFVSYMANTW